METTKKPALLALVRILDDARVQYAIIGGIAVQVHHPDPRTTLGIDVAVISRATIPRDALTASGFRFVGTFEHSENWLAADNTPVQFADDPLLAPAIFSAGEIALDDVTLRVIRTVDLLYEKLRAGNDPAWRRSKHLQDLADAAALIETDPDLTRELHPDERALLDRLPQ